MAEKAGWYPDPGERPDVFRWWTGVGWTAWLADNDEGPPPQGHDNPRITAVGVPRGDRQVSHTARTILVALLVVLVVLGLAAAGGNAVNRSTTHPDYAPTPSGLTESPPLADAEPAFDEATRQATFGDLSVTLPPGVVGEYAQYLGIEPMFFSQQAVPQPSGNDTWISLVAFGVYSGPPQIDLQGYVDYVLAFVAHKFFNEGEPAEITEVRPGDVSHLPAGRAISMTAEMRYRGTPGDAEYDYVEVIVVELNSAQRAVWVSTVPNNAEQDVFESIAESRASLRLN